MKIFFEYIKSHIKTLVLLVIFGLVFAGIFILYNIPPEAVIYAAAICLGLLFIFAVIDFIRFRQRHIVLKKLQEEVLYTLDHIPEPKTLPERDLRELIGVVFTEKQRLETEMTRKFSDQNEYFTLWVHQIKTPIAAMRLALHDDDTERGRLLSEDLQRIEQYAEMALCYMRLEEGNDFLIKNYDLDFIIKQAVKKFSDQFIGKKISLVYEPLDLKVLTDEKWLLFVIEQVLSNSLKYTKSGSIEIYSEEPKTLCIKDTGIGVAAEDLPRIFEKGYTGCNGRSDKKASGIGLYLCKRICTMLGHKITAESVVGKGTTIKIYLEEYTIKHE